MSIWQVKEDFTDPQWGITTKAGWYFSDEVEQGVGPFKTKEEAVEAEEDYGIMLNTQDAQEGDVLTDNQCAIILRIVETKRPIYMRYYPVYKYMLPINIKGRTINELGWVGLDWVSGNHREFHALLSPKGGLLDIRGPAAKMTLVEVEEDKE